MLRIPLFLLLLFIVPHSVACKKEHNPTINCWNPSSHYVTKELKRFYVISREIDEALFTNELERVSSLAKEYLELSEKYPKNWNYGNATHNAHVALGIVELRKKNITASASHLVLAGQSTGSPQLDSFGPDLKLANVLLKKGQREAVAKYLSGVKRFWEMDEGRIDSWLKDIEAGKTPKLSRFRR
ncbi:MAG: hypothetical protein AB2689_23435 [Candidatus Thiodiazotropha taylori]|nr:hypothetical protein [Candidatus Thiodiazotropha taylori]